MAARIGRKPRKHVPRVGPRGVPQPALRGPNDAPSVVPKETEQEIQRLHRYVRQKLTEIEQVYQYSPVGLVLMDMDYRFVRINERMAEINGLPVEAHIGRTLRQVLPDLADYIMELYRPVYERAEPVLNVELHGQTRRRARRRAPLASEFLSIPIRDGRGRWPHRRRRGHHRTQAPGNKGPGKRGAFPLNFRGRDRRDFRSGYRDGKVRRCQSARTRHVRLRPGGATRHELPRPIGE